METKAVLFLLSNDVEELLSAASLTQALDAANIPYVTMSEATEEASDMIQKGAWAMSPKPDGVILVATAPMIRTGITMATSIQGCLALVNGEVDVATIIKQAVLERSSSQTSPQHMN